NSGISGISGSTSATRRFPVVPARRTGLRCAGGEVRRLVRRPRHAGEEDDMHKPSAHAALLMVALALVLREESARAESRAAAGTGTSTGSSTQQAGSKQGAKKPSRPGKRHRRSRSAPSNDAQQAADKGGRLTALPDEQAAVYRAFAEH